MESDPRQTIPPELRVDQQLCCQLHIASTKVIGRWDRYLRRHGINFSEYTVLIALYERWPVGENALALKLNFDPFTFEDALANLERCRLLTRADDPAFPGQRRLEPSRKGLDLRPSLLDICQRLESDFGFPDADAEQLTARLRELSLAVTDAGLEDSDVALQQA